jgi:hypothetical protein
MHPAAVPSGTRIRCGNSSHQHPPSGVQTIGALQREQRISIARRIISPVKYRLTGAEVSVDDPRTSRIIPHPGPSPDI